MEILRQFYFIPPPPITEANAPDQAGRVYIVTGGYTGIGFELTQMLYGLNAIIYIAGRASRKADSAISRIQKAKPRSKGRLEKLIIDLSDLKTIKPGVEAFLAKEARLEVLVNNAGVMYPPDGSVDAQGNELCFGTNCLGSCLLYKLLEPHLAQTASVSAAGSPHGIIMDVNGRPILDGDMHATYGASKVGNLFMAKEYARRDTSTNGIVHACYNPGNLRTGLQRHWRGLNATLTDWFLLYPSVNGGYTVLYAVVSPDITVHNSGAYVHPWGRLGGCRADIQAAMEPASDKPGSGNAAKFVDWCEREIQPFL